MSETLLIALFSLFGSWCLALTAIWWSVRGDVKKISLAVDLFISGMGKAAAQVLHSPDDHLGIDELLDRYMENHHDLSVDDWIKLKEVCDRLQKDKTIDEGVRLAASTIMASFLAQLALHKIEGANPHARQLIREAFKKP